jgi:hypothetical protein
MTDVKKLQAVAGKLHQLLNELHAMGEFELSKQVVQLSQKVDQKVRGHQLRAQREKGSRTK